MIRVIHEDASRCWKQSRPDKELTLIMNSIPQKTCYKCKKPFPATLDFFYSDKRKKDGLSSRCKQCREVGRKPRYIPREGYKHCPQCGNDLPATLEYFYPTTSIYCPSGLDTYCRQCEQKRRQASYQRMKERGPLHQVPDEIICKKCGVSKPANKENFPIRPDCRYGLMETCTVCTYNAYQKPWVIA